MTKKLNLIECNLLDTIEYFDQSAFYEVEYYDTVLERILTKRCNGLGVLTLAIDKFYQVRCYTKVIDTP